MALSWLFAGGGLELYNEILATGSRSAGSNGRSTASMTCARCGSAPRASAWEMMKTMGVSVVTLAGGEVIPALERGAVEGAEWAIPSHDIVMGFQNVAKNYRHGRDHPDDRVQPADPSADRPGGDPLLEEVAQRSGVAAGVVRAETAGRSSIPQCQAPATETPVKVARRLARGVLRLRPTRTCPSMITPEIPGMSPRVIAASASVASDDDG